MKNVRRPQRRFPDLTIDEIRRICEDRQEKGLAKVGLGETTRPPPSSKLNGKKLTFVFDDYRVFNLYIKGKEEIEWSRLGKTYKKEYAQILELADTNIFFIHFLNSFSFPLVCYTIIVDMNNGLVTMVHAALGHTPDRMRDIDREFHFGYLKNFNDIPEQRHSFTDELRETIIDWHYDEENHFVARHMYLTPRFITYQIMMNGEDVEVESGTCDYVKIRDNIYIMSWVESNHQGVQGCVLMDLRDEANIHDVGSFFGISIDGVLDSHTFGARGEVKRRLQKCD